MRKITLRGKGHGNYFDEKRISLNKPSQWPEKYDIVYLSNFDPQAEIKRLKKQIARLKERKCLPTTN